MNESVPNEPPRPSEAALQTLLETYAPSDSEILGWLRPRVTDEMLLEVAKADYELDWEESLVELRGVRASGRVSHTSEFDVRENLWLCGWKNIASKSVSTNEHARLEAHVARLFCCAALLQTMGNSESYSQMLGENQMIAPLVDSAIELGPESGGVALRLLAWIALTVKQDAQERPFTPMAILLLRVATDDPLADEFRALLGWLFSEADGPNSDLQSGGKSAHWLIGASSFDEQKGMWRHLINSILGRRAEIEDEFAPHLRRIVACVNERRRWTR